MAEARRRLGMLPEKLEGLPGVNLGVLALPEGIRALGPDTLLARNREGLKSEHVRVRGDVAELMRRFGPARCAGDSGANIGREGCPAPAGRGKGAG